nr:ATP-binding cassette domain-containing protein [Actinomycetales bacterium]
SGSGKSTLLYSVSGLDTIDSGSISLDGVDLTSLTADGLADTRRERMGFVFQQPTLLRNLGLLENIVLTSSLDRIGTAGDRVERARELMERAGIWELRDRMPSQVSGGQLQRAGICRALMRRPRIVFCDEPTGALNSLAAAEVMGLLEEINADGTSLLVVSHDAHVAARADRVVFMRDGRIVDELAPTGSGEERVRVLTEQLSHLGI